MKYRLHDDIQLPDARVQLLNCVDSARNVVGLAPGKSISQLKHAYLEWVSYSQGVLRRLFTDPAICENLVNQSYWWIRDASSTSFLWQKTITDETERQATLMREYLEEVTRLEARLQSSPGVLTVIDTNVLMHFLPPEQVDWSAVVGEREVRLVLPLRVVEEIDEKKYTARDDQADRARRLLSQLRRQLMESVGGPVTIRDGVTIEVPIDNGPRKRTLDADQEILESCRELKSGGQEVVLITDDTGMTLRAIAHGIRVVSMPEIYLRKQRKVEANPE